MDQTLKVKCFLVLFIGFFQFSALSHDIPVHQAITFNAQQTAHDNSTVYPSFLTTVSSDIDFVEATNSMVVGSGFEDNADEPGDVGGKRSYNHFYDPLDNTFNKGLSDFPPDVRALVGINSFTWGSVSNCVGHDFTYGLHGVLLPPPIPPAEFFPGANVNTSNIWSWQNARGYEWLGLTAANQSLRHTNLLFMFQSVGQVMHLLEDTTQPQHVRNEQHVEKSTWQSPFEDYGLSNVASLNYQHAMLDWRGAGFTKLEDFWDRHLYNGSAAALKADVNGGTSTLGLAEWCNGNFLGVRHLYGEYFPKTSISYYPYPSLFTSTSFQKVRANLGYGVRPVVLTDGTFANRVYIDKTGDGITFSNHSVLTYLGAYARYNGPYIQVASTIRDANVLAAYHSQVIPKAVKYSAGLLDYFFRGNISITPTNFNPTNLVVTNLVVNDSYQSFSGGAFHLYWDDSSSNRYEITNGFSTTYSGSLETSGSITMAFTKTNAVEYLLVYQGSIGTSDPVDSGIAIIAKSFVIGTNVWTNSFENATSIQPEAGTYFCNGWYVEDGDVGVQTNGFRGAGVPMAYEGNSFLDLDGSMPGTISTNISTTVGQTYELSFAWCRNPDSIDGLAFNEPSHVPLAQILIDDRVIGVLAGNMLNSWGDLQWQQASYVFTASSSSTKLTFHSLDDSSSFSGVQFDAVYLKQGF
jgi:hypothetical protein